jgi:hypothetical protein
VDTLHGYEEVRTWDHRRGWSFAPFSTCDKTDAAGPWRARSDAEDHREDHRQVTSADSRRLGMFLLYRVPKLTRTNGGWETDTRVHVYTFNVCVSFLLVGNPKHATNTA